MPVFADLRVFDDLRAFDDLRGFVDLLVFRAFLERAPPVIASVILVDLSDGETDRVDRPAVRAAADEGAVILLPPR